jgi:hypothetical protein
LSLCLIALHANVDVWLVEIRVHVFLTSPLDGGV